MYQSPINQAPLIVAKGAFFFGGEQVFPDFSEAIFLRD
jgi:hypothetical protein